MTERVDRIPTPSVVVLVGASGSGKSTWATATFGADAVVSSDRLRAVVGEGEHDQSASRDAFDLLDQIVRRRVARGLTTVIDTMGLDRRDRERWRRLAHEAGLASVVVAFDTPPAAVRARNVERERRAPAAVQRRQLAAYAEQRDSLGDEGFDHLHVVADATVPTRTSTTTLHRTVDAAAAQRADPVGLRFGLHVSSFELDGGAEALATQLAEIARTAEELGFSSLRVMDHPVQIPQVGRRWDAILEPFTTLTHVASVTDRIRIGPLVAGITYRNIGLLGKTIATLDVLSGGRVDCGIGLAWYERDHRAYGYELPPVAERYRLVEDALEFLPVLWGPGTKPWRGRTFSTPEAICYPRPLQDPVPILVGGSGARTLRLAARHAQACNLFGTPDVVAERVDVLRAHCAAEHRDPADVQVTHLGEVLVADDAGQLDALVAERGPKRRVDAWKARANVGLPEDQIGRFRALADAGVDEAIVAVPGLRRADDLAPFATILDAFS